MNINSLPNKFDQLKLLVQNNLDILVLTETKLDASFPTSQFLLNGFSKPYRLDRNRHGGGVLIYVSENIPNKELNEYSLPKDIEGLFVELNFRKSKWLLFGSYNPPNQNNEYFLETLGKGLDKYSKYYDKFALIGDFNMEVSETQLSIFLETYNAKNLVKEHTCFKSKDNPSCIDLIITNSPLSFQNTTTVVTGLSDFHKMVVTALKISINKCTPKIVTYRDYKKFDLGIFKTELRNSMQNIKDYNTFETIFLTVLNKHAPIKQKVLRGNHVPYMTKALRKAIMKRSELKTKYLKHRTQDKLLSYKKQKNYCSKLYKKERKKYYDNLNIKNVTDNKIFWKTVKPFLSDKVTNVQKINLLEEGKLISQENEITESFSNFFEKAVNSLDIKGFHTAISTSDINDPIEKAIEKFKEHPSIKAINANVAIAIFDFQKVNSHIIFKEIAKLDVKKSGTFSNIPTKKLKETSEICTPILCKIWNDEIIENKNFPENLKLADVTPVHKKNDSNLVKNYRPVSVLPTVSKVFEKIIQTQITQFIEKFLSPYLCGYRKGFSTQHALMSFIEKWKSCLDKKGFCGAILMDLSKAFDTINHELLIAKLHAYGFSKEALTLILSYLTNRWQRVKINATFSSWKELIQGVPQGSILGPLLFNIYINDLFFILSDIEICNFADDTTPFVCDLSIETVLSKLENNSEIAISWFECNYMKMNSDKCHLLIGGKKYEHIWAKIGKDIIWESNNVRLLGITIDNELKFEKHLEELCVKANRKLSVLTRLAKFLSADKRRTIFKAFIESQFKYCPLIWMFHSRRMNNKINKLHERSLRIVYDDYSSPFEALLEKDRSFSIHHQNIQCLLTEIFKMINGLSENTVLENIFTRNSTNYNLRSQADLQIPDVHSTYNGLNSLRYYGAVMWNSLPITLRNIETLSEFKGKIKQWKPKNCPCRLCKTYIDGVGFV